ncbi:DUF5665 domain-containing protein [Paenibacillus thermoaerophilus]|uniref:DUF5665 domain-containing protein n=1 Tax=Paenibacillus thermoaerophilus TaxID=1215385 RepID=A0ABW2UXT0_9BACL|nr:DUF5665 domain-containing protein [Paenibacillus thermoaerophilus]
MGLGMGETLHDGSAREDQQDREDRSGSGATGRGDTAAAAADLAKRLDTLAVRIEASRIAEYVELLHHPRKLLMSSLLTGIARGIGITIGVTVFAAVLVQLLRMLGALNLPVIGDWIADIVEIVESELDGRRIG